MGKMRLPKTLPEFVAMKLVVDRQARSKAEQQRLEANPVAWQLRCPLCTKLMPITATKKKDSFYSRCPLCGLRLFLDRSGWDSRGEMQRAAQVLDGR